MAVSCGFEEREKYFCPFTEAHWMQLKADSKLLRKLNIDFFKKTIPAKRDQCLLGLGRVEDE